LSRTFDVEVTLSDFTVAFYNYRRQHCQGNKVASIEGGMHDQNDFRQSSGS
jgi:hypothetical protein